jgi:preprotein translocase subunit SecA
MPGRRWSDGLHQAIEAKENVTLERESQTLATITIQNYFRLYEKLSGMTGTAETEANEFWDIYKLGVVVAPPNRPSRRADENDSIFKTRREKYTALVEDIKRRYATGQPVLVGTVSVESSELISRMLARERITHNVLNAKFHQQEAEIVARAGQKGAVTIATNMAGRGTDIKLGAGVDEIGGLCVIGTERHEARRIDRQLRGRCARQGDPGASKFYISFEDDLMRNFGDSRRIAELMTKLGMEDNEDLQHPWLNGSVETAQKRVEQRNYAIRKHTLQYDDVMNQQRTVIYAYRTEILNTENTRGEVFEVIEEIVKDRAETLLAAEVKDPEAFLSWANNTFPLSLTHETVDFNQTAEQVAESVIARIREAYELKTKFEEPEAVHMLERMIILTAIDKLWQEHLYGMDGLRQSITLRAYGQKDPLVEYKQEAYKLFEDLMARIKTEIAHNVFRSASSLMAFESFLRALPQRLIHDVTEGSAAMAPTDAPSAADAPSAEPEPKKEVTLPIVRQGKKLQRNDPCPVDPSKKFKNCCGANGSKTCLKG